MSAPLQISDIASVVTKGTTPTTYGMLYVEEGLNFVKAEALNDDSGLDPNGFAQISEETHDRLARSKLEEDDVLITIAGANVGKCGYVTSDILPANTNQAVGIIRSKQDAVCPRYLYYWLKRPAFRQYCLSVAGQSAQPNLNLTNLKNIKIELPDLSTQKTTSFILSRYDNLIQNNRRRIALLEESARLLYREWFVHFRVSGSHSNLLINKAPIEWRRNKLSEVLTLQRGFDLPATQRSSGEVPVFGSTGIVGYHNESKVERPTIVTGRSGSLGKILITDTLSWPLNTTLWMKELKIPSIYFAYFLLQHLPLAAFDGGAAVPTLDRNVLHELEVLIPSHSVLS
ncbi:MAG: restriction endonuclease subunit S, partial [Gammaproteobacteria bacterium]